MKGYVTREEASKVDPIYQEILEKESHHDHKIILNKHGILSWEADPFIEFLWDNKLMDLNRIVATFIRNGITKNSEIWRKLFRDLGYSLNGYWTIFYCDLNNPDADEYIGG